MLITERSITGSCHPGGDFRPYPSPRQPGIVAGMGTISLEPPDATPKTARRALNLLVCLDGSARSAEAVRPSVELARRHGEDVSVVVVHDGPSDVTDQLGAQLSALGLAVPDPIVVANKTELLQVLLERASSGAIPVVSAFGRWNTGSLFGLLGDLVRADVNQVIAIGPHVDPARYRGQGPIVVAIDTVCRAEPMIAAVERFVIPDTSKLVVSHVVPPAEAGISYATEREAAKFKSQLDIRVESSSVPGQSVSESIADIARLEHACLIVARSWHRTIPDRASAASSSLSIVAKAPCPVLIVS